MQKLIALSSLAVEYDCTFDTVQHETIKKMRTLDSE